MAVFLVEVNTFRSDGHGHRQTPEFLGITTSLSSAQEAIEWTIADKDIFTVRDLSAVLLSMSDKCWFTPGPETEQ